MSTQQKVALVVGAHGVIGRNLVEHLATSATGRSSACRAAAARPRAGSGTSRSTCSTRTTAATKLGGLAEVTHIFYAAYQDRPDLGRAGARRTSRCWSTSSTRSSRSRRGLRHISLMQGYKVYGAHLGPFKTPAREDDPPPHAAGVQRRPAGGSSRTGSRARRGPGRRSARPWSCGFALGNPMNLAMVIAVYAVDLEGARPAAALPRQARRLRHADRDDRRGLLARATVWAATDERCANQAFNITNGDLFRWNEMWPKIARFFELEVAPPLPMSLDDVMADKEPLWNEMVEKHGLAPTLLRGGVVLAVRRLRLRLGLRLVRRRLEGAAARLPRVRRDRGDVPATSSTDLRRRRIIP